MCEDRSHVPVTLRRHRHLVEVRHRVHTYIQRSNHRARVILRPPSGRKLGPVSVNSVRLLIRYAQRSRSSCTASAISTKCSQTLMTVTESNATSQRIQTSQSDRTVPATTIKYQLFIAAAIAQFALASSTNARRCAVYKGLSECFHDQSLFA